MNIHAGKLLAAAAALVFTMSMQTADADELSGPTQKGQICMQKVFGTPVTNSNRLNCTANDIRLAKAVKVSRDNCTAGETFDLTATFEVNVTANSRYDAGFFFRLDGNNARGDGSGATGMCSLSALDIPPKTPGLKLDADNSGDLNSGTYFATFTLEDVECKAVGGTGPDANKLLLPNCTSWHSNASTAAEITNPFDFKPDTKSKCTCDDTFSVDVTVETATLTVQKTAFPTSVNENGGAVTFTASLKNDSNIASLTITKVIDTVTGGTVDDLGSIPNCIVGDPNVADQPNADEPGPCSPPSAVTSHTTCPELVGDVLAPKGTGTCDFSAWLVGDESESHVDTVQICGTGSENGLEACDTDDATVDFNNVKDAGPAVKKEASAKDCQVTVKYDVSVSNPSTFDAFTIDKLEDTAFGDLTTTGHNGITSTTCVKGTKIEVGGLPYKCTFDADFDSTPACDIDHTNKVKATATDEDGDTFVDVLSNSVNVKVKPDITTVP